MTAINTSIPYIRRVLDAAEARGILTLDQVQSGMPGRRWTITFIGASGYRVERSYSTSEMDAVCTALHSTHNLYIREVTS